VLCHLLYCYSECNAECRVAVSLCLRHCYFNKTLCSSCECFPLILSLPVYREMIKNNFCVTYFFKELWFTQDSQERIYSNKSSKNTFKNLNLTTLRTFIRTYFKNCEYASRWLVIMTIDASPMSFPVFVNLNLHFLNCSCKWSVIFVNCCCHIHWTETIIILRLPINDLNRIKKTIFSLKIRKYFYACKLWS
jgi:hypothetical protein